MLRRSDERGGGMSLRELTLEGDGGDMYEWWMGGHKPDNDDHQLFPLDN